MTNNDILKFYGEESQSVRLYFQNVQNTEFFSISFDNNGNKFLSLPSTSRNDVAV